MKQYRINFANVKTKHEFYDCVVEGLKLPAWCGRNPDAIWDMLTGYMEHEMTIYIENINIVAETLYNDVMIFRKILENAVKLYDGKFKVDFIS